MKRCVECNGTKLREEMGRETRLFHLADDTALEFVLDNVPATVCETCGERYFEADVVRREDDLITRELVIEGVRDPAVFRWLRKAMGMKAAELGELLGVTPETISHWENGHREPDRTVWNTLAELVFDHLGGKTATADRLRRLAEAREPRRRMRLSFAPG